MTCLECGSPIVTHDGRDGYCDRCRRISRGRNRREAAVVREIENATTTQTSEPTPAKEEG